VLIVSPGLLFIWSVYLELKAISTHAYFHSTSIYGRARRTAGHHKSIVHVCIELQLLYKVTFNTEYLSGTASHLCPSAFLEPATVLRIRS
jgi:hypothetical protein